MWEVVDFSHAILAALVGLQALVLRTMMKETLHLMRAHQSTRTLTPEPGAASLSPTASMLGKRMPSFSVDVFGSAEPLTEKSFLGKTMALLFVKADVDAPATIGALVRSIWNQIDGCLYLVCNGAEHRCRELRNHFELTEIHDESVELVVDQDGSLASRLDVVVWPSAVVVDESGVIRRTGQPSLTQRP